MIRLDTTQFIRLFVVISEMRGVVLGINARGIGELEVEIDEGLRREANESVALASALGMEMTLKEARRMRDFVAAKDVKGTCANESNQRPG